MPNVSEASAPLPGVGQFWTPITPPKGSFLQADPHKSYVCHQTLYVFPNWQTELPKELSDLVDSDDEN